MFKLVSQNESLPVKGVNDSFSFDILEYNYESQIVLSTDYIISVQIHKFQM
jgi:hypothetical protein